jgi:acetyl esterase/lipase
VLAPEIYTPLWNGPAPLSLGTADEDVPAVEPLYPANPTGAAFIICPGGGYGVLVDHEKRNVAAWLGTLGITTFILRSRLGPRYHHPCPLTDAARAARFLRHHAHEHRLDPQRLGIIGFSAGGHLAATLATHFDLGHPGGGAHDPVEHHSARPDLQILIYPVITMLAHGHSGTRENLLGATPSPHLLELLSNERHVTPHTPPCFLVHSTQDQVVPVAHADLYAAALQKQAVPCQYLRGEYGDHGFALQRFWTDPCADWLRHHHYAR